MAARGVGVYFEAPPTVEIENFPLIASFTAVMENNS